MSKLLYLLIILHLFNCKGEQNNVCKHFLDYLTIDNNSNCWYNPNVGGDLEQLVKSQAYPLESYDITTEDGYINRLYRIPHNTTNQNQTRQPILLHAGLTGSPLTFLVRGNQSLAFFLSRNGFDVWLATRRGVAYSKGHIYYNRNDKEFWDFTFHEVGYYDTKAEIELIKNKTENKIVLLGYSMGTTESYVYAILRKEHAKKNLAGIVSLSPFAFTTHSTVFITKLAKMSNFLQMILKFFKIYAFFDASEIPGKEGIKNSPFLSLLFYKKVLTFLIQEDHIDAADLPVFFAAKPSSTSVKTLVHFAQEVNSGGKFQQFDYGPVKNVLLYNNIKPPLYNVSEINVPVYLFYGKGDVITSQEDVLKLFNELTVKNKSLTVIPHDKEIKFNHFDFTMSKNIEKLFYEQLLKVINNKLKQ